MARTLRPAPSARVVGFALPWSLTFGFVVIRKGFPGGVQRQGWAAHLSPLHSEFSYEGVSTQQEE
jgi:hypothetical protein